MDSADLTNDRDLSDFDPPGRIHLEACPRCDYLLTGLPAIHRCPECGLEYDDRTFVLTGISRGTSNMSAGRKVAWLFVCLGAFVFPDLLLVAFATITTTILTILLAVTWLGFIVYLIFTSRRERRGIENFIFTAGGFGYCADLKPGIPGDSRMIPWLAVDKVIIDRKGPNWHRIRMGMGDGRGRRLSQVCFDVGVRCDEETAEWIDKILNDRIMVARNGKDLEMR